MTARAQSVRIGGGAGSVENRIPPALELAQYGDLDYMVFECLAERTIAPEQLLERRSNESNSADRFAGIRARAVRFGICGDSMVYDGFR